MVSVTLGFYTSFLLPPLLPSIEQLLQIRLPLLTLKKTVFVYKFIDPSNRQSYDVMWDYVGGFVRISPFFKSCKHKKVPTSVHFTSPLFDRSGC
jgi:hypothetical protein